MLWEEMERYTKLTGEDATHVPIMKLGAYLDGYEKGIEVLDKIRAEIEKTTSRYTISRERGAMGQVEWSDRLIKESEVLEIIDEYKGGE